MPDFPELPDLDLDHLTEFILDLKQRANEEPQTLVTDPKDNRDFKSSIKVIRSDESTYIVVAAIHKEKDRNSLVRISCERGSPITGYVYDSANDCYLVDCVDYIPLGYIDVSFSMENKDADWIIRSPMPNGVLKRHMNSRQKSDLKQFKSAFKGDDYTFRFIQIMY